jgi:hypothetical protein
MNDTSKLRGKKAPLKSKGRTRMLVDRPVEGRRRILVLDNCHDGRKSIFIIFKSALSTLKGKSPKTFTGLWALLVGRRVLLRVLQESRVVGKSKNRLQEVHRFSLKLPSN